MNLSRLVFLIIFFIAPGLHCQTKQDLQSQKKQIKNEIRKIEIKLSESLKQKDLIISNAEDINYKINLQQNLINNINTQLNLILFEIEDNEFILLGKSFHLSSSNGNILCLRKFLSNLISSFVSSSIKFNLLSLK